ncbi:MAG: hypothetical protein U5K53_01855 [Halanaerobiales bacterium]|nr:hypothetical protein [Halanaerobiales bacterium]
MDINLPFAFKADISSLRSVHMFNDGLRNVLNEINSFEFECQIHNNFFENNGPHWSGFRCFLMDRQDRSLYYLHIGLIFHPDTKKGIMVELDKESNLNSYQEIRDNIKKGENFKVNKEEADYLKLFLKEKKLENIDNSNKIDKQLSILRDFLKEALAAIIKGGRK